MKTLNTKKITKYKMFLIGTWAVCVLLLGAGVLFFHLPQKEVLNRVQKQFDESRQQRELAELAGQETVREKAQQRLDEVQQHIQQYSLPSDDVTTVAFEIGRTAGELGLSGFSSKHLSQQKLSTVKESKLLAEAWLVVEFEASYEQIVQFVHRLEQSRPVVFIEDLSIRRADNGQANHEVKMELSFLTRTEKENRSVAMH